MASGTTVRVPARVDDRPGALARLELLALSRWAPWALVGLGAALRLLRYALNRSLWIDEAFVALNVVSRSFSGLLRPLGYFQGAPLAFLAAEKAADATLGGGEYALRLVPLLAGLASLPVFLVLARELLEPLGALLAMACFALSMPLIAYSAEVKPYSLDVLVAGVLLALALRLSARPWSSVRLAALGLAGAAGVWFSFPAALVLIAVWVPLAVGRLRARRWRDLTLLCATAGAWAVSFLGAYVVSIRHLRQLTISPTSPQSGYVPHGAGDLAWYGNAVTAVFRTALGVPRPLVGAAVLVALIGCVASYRGGRRAVAIACAPVAVAVAAATLHLYGLGGRFSLFLVPCLVLLVAAGIQALLRSEGRAGVAAGVVAAGLVVAAFVALVANDVLAPSNEEIKPVLAYVAAHRRPTDTILVDYWAQYAFAYYGRRYGFPTPPAHAVARAGGNGTEDASYPPALRSDPPALRSDPPTLIVAPYQARLSHGLVGLGRLRAAHRVWAIFSHRAAGRRFNEQSMYRVALNRMGHPVRGITTEGAGAYLYVLRARHGR